MKFKKILTTFVIIIAVCACFAFTGCNLKNNNNQRQMAITITDFDSVVSNTTPVSNLASSRSDMVESYINAMATVIIYHTDEEGNESPASWGSGVAIYAGGYIATNWHVVASYVNDTTDSYSIKVQFMFEGEMTETNASLVWNNQDYDLAVVRSSYVNMPFVQMSDRWINNTINPLRIAEEVWTLGTPADLSLFASYSQGTISSTSQKVSVSGGRIYEELIQHTAAISNGSSGGGLFDANGYLIGLNTLGLSSSVTADRNSLFFSVPIYALTKIMPSVAELDQDGDETTSYYIPKVGVYAYDANYTSYSTDYTFLGNGVYVPQLVIGGGADKVELPINIAIIGISTITSAGEGSYGYYKVTNRNSFMNALVNFKPAESIKVYYTDVTADNLNGVLTYNKTIVLG